MKLDWELVRTLLLAVEALDGKDSLEADAVVGFDDVVVTEHLRLLGEAGFVSALGMIEQPPTYLQCRLTWEGHQFLMSVRRDTVWKRVKHRLAERGVELSLDAIRVTAGAIMRGLLGGSK